MKRYQYIVITLLTCIYFFHVDMHIPSFGGKINDETTLDQSYYPVLQAISKIVIIHDQSQIRKKPEIMPELKRRSLVSLVGSTEVDWSRV
jgi:hypothetical protein